ncbi:MAG: hypothetical protein JEZ00_07035 [Anaerolineaceae bacterium]|nr:hypothetical protein [Anaerolineaceae bacterium]
MPSPFVILLLSIIPGLGFFVMKKPKIGIGIWVMLLVCAWIYFTTTNEAMSSYSFQFAILIWIGQIFSAYREAKISQRLDNGSVFMASPINHEVITNPIDMPRKARFGYKAMQIVKQQAMPGEQVVYAVLGRVMPSMGSHILFGAFAFANMREMYIGYTSKGLLCVEVDMMAEPAGVIRIAVEDIKSIQYKQGILNDQLGIDANNQDQLNCKVSYLLREQSQAIAQAFAQQNGT